MRRAERGRVHAAVLVLWLLVPVSLVACGDDNDDSADRSTPVSGSVDAPAAEPAPDVSVFRTGLFAGIPVPRGATELSAPSQTNGTVTDPVLSEAIIGHAQVPSRLRDFLNVESGLNDGLALPFVVVLLSLLSQEEATALGLSRQIGFGIGLGVLTPLAAVWLWNRRSLGVAERDRSIAPIAIVLVAVPAAFLLDVNPFLASFTAGVTLGVVRPAYVEAFRPIGEGLSQLVKLGALFAFGLVFSHLIPATMSWRSVVFAVAVLIVVRPVALLVAFAGHQLDPVLFATASWFGPKGFASVTFSLLVLQRGIDNGERIFSYASQVVGLSILAHSSTDVVIARKLAAREKRAQSSPD